MIDLFQHCQDINDLLTEGNDLAARNMLIRLLGQLDKDQTRYPPVLNELIRAAGLFPYLQLDSATWDQKFVHSAFEVDVGKRTATLHREQSHVLSRLLNGKNIAVSAPTSFGKSFIVDAFIAAKQPSNVVIIVPTIALMDETRRRLFQKFSGKYNIVTAPDSKILDKNIFIFPQERAFGYLSKISKIDLLVIDEFYKASVSHDKDRAPSLIKAILKLSEKADQRYYLAPNIKTLGENILTRDMEFIELLDFNTVFLEKHDLYKELGGDEEAKNAKLIQLIEGRTEKSLIYAGTYSEIKKVSELVNSRLTKVDRPHTNHFANWLRNNYSKDWSLADLVERGVGVHNGQMHRCLSQIQIQIFEHEKGFDSIVSTSSIIEGVNTSAQNVIIWRSKLGGQNLKDFTYKNIIGRGGRMFKHFIGKIYLLDAPPKNEDTQLEITFPDQILGDIDESNTKSLTKIQQDRIIEYKLSMSAIIGSDNLARIRQDNLLKDSDSDFLLRLALDMKNSPAEWKGFAFLNSSDPDNWDRMLYKIINLKPSGWDAPYGKVVLVAKHMAGNWRRSLPEVIGGLSRHGIGIDEFFKLERTVTFKLASLLSDTNELHKIIVDPSADISSFVGRLGRAFLPPSVYHLEEYGLPRMISKKIQLSGLINFEDPSSDLFSTIKNFQTIGYERFSKIDGLSAFDKYVLRFFFAGITPGESAD